MVLIFATHFLKSKYGYFRWLQAPSPPQKMHRSLSNFPGKYIRFVQNKPLSSDMQVSRAQKLCILLQVQLLACGKYWSYSNSLQWLTVYRPFNDFMQEEAEGQPIAQASHTLTRQIKKRGKEKETLTYYTNHFSINCKSVTIVLIIYSSILLCIVLSGHFPWKLTGYLKL